MLVRKNYNHEGAKDTKEKPIRPFVSFVLFVVNDKYG
jgi:hypothetical protein